MERTPIPTHRSVSFSHKLSHPFDGTAFANGVCLGDVDNDGGHELVVAATEGQVRRCLPASCHLAALLYAWNPAPFLFLLKTTSPATPTIHILAAALDLQRHEPGAVARPREPGHLHLRDCR